MLNCNSMSDRWVSALLFLARHGPLCAACNILEEQMGGTLHLDKACLHSLVMTSEDIHQHRSALRALQGGSLPQMARAQ